MHENIATKPPMEKGQRGVSQPNQRYQSMSRWVAAACKRSFALGGTSPCSILAFRTLFAVATSYSVTRKSVCMNRPALNLAPHTPSPIPHPFPPLLGSSEPPTARHCQSCSFVPAHVWTDPPPGPLTEWESYTYWYVH